MIYLTVLLEVLLILSDLCLIRSIAALHWNKILAKAARRDIEREDTDECWQWYCDWNVADAILNPRHWNALSNR